MHQGTTARILDTAEQLFAERGFTETSLRSITGKAGVNLAAVNYHFGSKKALIQAVFERFLTPFCASLDAAIDRKLAETGSDRLSLEALLGLIARTAIDVNAQDPARGVVFMRLTGLAYHESQGHLRRYLGERYGHTFARLQWLMSMAAPDIPPIEMFWRLHFALGSVIFTLSGLAPLMAFGESDYGKHLRFDDVVDRLLAFVVAGIRQPGTP